MGNLILKTGIGGMAGIDQDVLDARSKLDFLKNELYKDNFTGTHNIRSNTEANKIAGSATNLDTKTNSAATIDQQLSNLKTQIYRERANANAAAGRSSPTSTGAWPTRPTSTPRATFTTAGRRRSRSISAA